MTYKTIYRIYRSPRLDRSVMRHICSKPDLRRKTTGHNIIQKLSIITIACTVITVAVFIVNPSFILLTLKRNLPELFELLVTEEADTPELNPDWIIIDEDEFTPTEEQNTGIVKTDNESRNTMLAIDSVNIEIPISEGSTEDAMYNGAWHFPNSAPIESPSNTVIFGHRFYKVPPAKDTFYNLDKVNIGDTVRISDNTGTIYIYTVTETKVVAKNDRSILESTDHDIITLVTCTPLWTSEERLVVIAVKNTIASQ